MPLRPIVIVPVDTRWSSYFFFQRKWIVRQISATGTICLARGFVGRGEEMSSVEERARKLAGRIRCGGKLEPAHPLFAKLLI